MQDQPTFQGSHQAHLHFQDIDENRKHKIEAPCNLLVSYGFWGNQRLEGTKVERSNNLSNSSSNTHAFLKDKWEEIKVERSNNLSNTYAFLKDQKGKGTKI